MHNIHNHAFNRTHLVESTAYKGGAIEVVNRLMEVPEYDRSDPKPCYRAIATLTVRTFEHEYSGKLSGKDFKIAISIGDVSEVEGLERTLMFVAINGHLEDRRLYNFHVDFAECGCVVIQGNIKPEAHADPVP